MKNTFYKVAWIAAVSISSLFFIIPAHAVTIPVDANMLLRVINQQRQSNNLPPFRMNATLNIAATSRLTDMQSRNYFGHTSPDGMQPWDFIEQAGYRYKSSGENLAKDYLTADDMVNAWLTSDTHRTNLLSNVFTEIGIASEKINGHAITVALFALPFSTSPSETIVNEPITSQPIVAGVQTTVPSQTDVTPQIDSGLSYKTNASIPDLPPILNNQPSTKTTSPLALISSIILSLGVLALTSWWVLAAMI